MTTALKHIVTIAILVTLACAAGKAATRHYQEREDAFLKECQAARQKLGLTPADLRAKYPTPEIRLVSAACVVPGGSADLVVTGRFSQGARFFVENDSFEVLKESAGGDQYRATIKAAAGIGPEHAALAAINPVTGQTVRAAHAVKVGGQFEWTMTAANGWRVAARSRSTERCAVEATAREYDVSFFRPGEQAPFEKVTGRLGFLPANNRNYRFDLAEPSMAPPALETYQALMQKLADPKLSAAERDAVTAKLAAAQNDMTAALAKMSDPSYVKQQMAAQQRREQEFGCRALELTLEGGQVTGEMNCSDKTGRRIAMTGTVVPLK